MTRYVDLLWTFYEPKHLYLTVYKIIFISSSAYVVYLMVNDYKPTHDPNQDTFKVQYLLAGSAALAIFLPYQYTPSEILWTFSIWLESVAILPQLILLQQTQNIDNLTGNYVFLLGYGTRLDPYHLDTIGQLPFLPCDMNAVRKNCDNQPQTVAERFQ